MYRYDPKSPVFLKKSSDKRDLEAKTQADLSDEDFQRFQGGDKLLLSMVIAYLQHIRDHDWTSYVMTNTAYIQIKRTIIDYQNFDLKGKDKVTTTKELAEMTKYLATLGETLKTFEAELFDQRKDDETALSLHLKKYAPRVIDGLTVDLIRFPVEYFATETRDSFANKGTYAKKKRA